MRNESDILMKEKLFESFQIGMSASQTRIITDEDVKKFSEISGDINPIHLDAAYAEASRYKRKIAHGLISVSYFSGLFGAILPGPGCVYASQNIKFLRPVYLGDEVVASVIISAIDVQSSRLTFETICKVKGKVVISGTAEIFIP
jgi:3-hydroxybutyryl-CoA dehydratase